MGGGATTLRQLDKDAPPLTLEDGEIARASMQRLVKGELRQVPIGKRMRGLLSWKLDRQLTNSTTFTTPFFSAYYPEVLISYATGRREGDAPGCGPGMFYCQVVLLGLC